MNLHVSFIYKNTLGERVNFNTDVIETKQKITEVKYDAVQWIIHDKLTYYIIVRDQDQDQEQKLREQSVFILSVNSKGHGY